MSDRDARAAWTPDVWRAALDDAQAEVQRLRAALAAADAVQGDVTNSPALTEAYLKGLAAGRSEPADDRRMVDLDVIDHWIRQECGAVDNRQADAVADELLERFGGSAPNKEQP